MNKILALLMLIFLTCCSGDGDWKNFKAIGLPDSGETYIDMVFVNNKLGYLGGSKLARARTNENLHKAVLYKTINRGESWQQLPLNFKGGVKKVFEFNDTLILLLQHVSSDTNYILKYTNYGKVDKPILSNPRAQSVMDAFFESPTSGKIILNTQDGHQLLKYDGINWQVLLTLPNYYYLHTIYKDKVLSLIPEGSAGKTKGLLVTNIQNKQEQQILFNEPYFIASRTKVGDNLYLAARKAGKGKIIKYTGERIEIISLGKYADYEPDEIFAFGDTIILVGSRQKDVALVGVAHSVLISGDGGKTWTLEELPNPLSFRPAFLYRDQFFITNEFGGYMQVRK